MESEDALIARRAVQARDARAPAERCPCCGTPTRTALNACCASLRAASNAAALETALKAAALNTAALVAAALGGDGGGGGGGAGAGGAAALNTAALEESDEPRLGGAWVAWV